MRYEIYLPTTDDWCGNFEGNRMLLSLVDREGVWCIYASGTDDFALEREFNTEKLAKLWFNSLAQRKMINQQDLLSMGFQSACEFKIVFVYLHYGFER